MTSPWVKAVAKYAGGDCLEWSKTPPSDIEFPEQICEWADKHYCTPEGRAALRGCAYEFAYPGEFDRLGDRFYGEDGFRDVVVFDHEDHEDHEGRVENELTSRGSLLAELKDDNSRAEELKALWEGYGSRLLATSAVCRNADGVLDLYIESRYADECRDLVKTVCDMGLEIPERPQPSFYSMRPDQIAIERAHLYILWRAIHSEQKHVTLEAIFDTGVDRDKAIAWTENGETTTLWAPRMDEVCNGLWISVFDSNPEILGSVRKILARDAAEAEDSKG